jgi:hypothetical protein
MLVSVNDIIRKHLLYCKHSLNHQRVPHSQLRHHHRPCVPRILRSCCVNTTNTKQDSQLLC